MGDLDFATQLRPAVDLAVAVLAAMAAIAVELLRAAGAFLVLAAAFLAATFLAATLRLVLAVLVAVVSLALAAALAVLATLLAKGANVHGVNNSPRLLGRNVSLKGFAYVVVVHD